MLIWQVDVIGKETDPMQDCKNTDILVITFYDHRLFPKGETSFPPNDRVQSSYCTMTAQR